MSNDRIACDEVVHRAITSKRWIDGDGNPTPEAFMRRILRSGEAESDLSVFRRVIADWEHSRLTFKITYGAASLHVGRVRDLGNGIDIVASPQAATETRKALPEHASVINLPDPVSDPDSAEFMASRLRNQARMLSVSAPPARPNQADSFSSGTDDKPSYPQCGPEGNPPCGQQSS